VITEKDLQEAIAECEGQRNPNANTCIKLAAFYTIREHMYGTPAGTYSFATEPDKSEEKEVPAEHKSDTEFAQIVKGMRHDDFMPVIDELMTTLQIVQPRLYDGVMRKLTEY
jgi:hypothetical protein